MLKPRQIIQGKLGSAMLQMLIYQSVLAPCMAFTYLLRGVDIFLVLSVVFYNAVLCWLLSCIGLMLATITTARHWQAVLSVIFILGLGLVCLYSSIGTAVLIGEDVPIPFGEWEFNIGQAALITAVLCAGGMALLAATAGITMRSENRSTPLRVGALVCHVVGFAWLGRYWLRFPDEEFLIAVYAVLAPLAWYLAGAMMTGEEPLLSDRVRRGLPQTWLGRVFLTLFFPGPGTGYLFAVANLCVVAAGAWMLVVVRHHGQWPADMVRAVNVAWMAAAYGVFYLGLNRLILRRLEKRMMPGPQLGLVLGVVLVALGTLFPLILQFSLAHLMVGADDYTLMQITNPFWTLVEVADGRKGWATPAATGITPLMLVLAPLVLVVFLMNLLRLSSSLLPARAATPARVLAEQEASRPAPAVVSEPAGPFDSP